MSAPLTEEQWKVVDGFIFRGRTLNAVKAIREATGARIPDAVDLTEKRRWTLHQTRPDEFIGDEGYDGSGTSRFDT